MPELPKVGLVLSGGGAKGAYQIGVLRALQKLGTQVDMVSGASIGALNGGVLAGAPTFSKGVERVERLWSILAEASPLKVNTMTYIKLMLAAGSVLQPKVRLLMLALGIVNASDSSLLSEDPLEELMDEYLDTDGLANGIPLYVSIYKSIGAMQDLGRCLLAASGLKDTPDSEFLHLQSLPASEQRNALLASAALPALFKARDIDGNKYTDGGQGGWSKAQGNTPIQPLIDAGCNLIIVTHLSNGSLWSRHDFPGVTVLEVRPQSNMARADGFLGDAKDLLGFDAKKIPSWIEQGYLDTLHCIGRVKDATSSRVELKFSKQKLIDSECSSVQADASLDDVMSRIMGN